MADERRDLDAHFERHLTAIEPTRQATPARAMAPETEPALLSDAV
jgi:hypothetical protein